MPICPKCKGEIESLNNYVSGENHYRFSLNEFDGNTIGDFDFEEFQTNGKTNDFECPNCSEVLFTDEGKATKFLEGQDEFQQIVAEKIEQIKENKKDVRNLS